jgi:hypothetical protein
LKIPSCLEVLALISLFNEDHKMKAEISIGTEAKQYQAAEKPISSTQVMALKK